MSLSDNDITPLVEYSDNDGEFLPLTKCACGQKFVRWDFILHTDRDMPTTCPNCGRKMYFSVSVHVLEVLSAGAT